MKYSAIDLHANNSVVVVTDENDRVVAQRRMANELEKIIAFLLPWREQLAGVVVESTYNWYWLVDGLMQAGFVVKLANTVAIRKYDGLKHSGDEADARHLAQLLRLGILPTGTILAPDQRASRDLGRKRLQLVRSRTQHILAIENIVARQTGAKISSNQVKRLSAETLQAMGLAEDVALAVQSNLAVVATLEAQIERLEKRLQERVGKRAEYVLLRTVPGIGAVLATIIVLEIGSIERFAQVGQFASYARCVDSQHLSNGKKKGEGNTKNGNKYLSWAFIEAANFAQRYCAEAKRFYERKKARTNTLVATKALAHKLARACYHMLKQGQAFDVKRCFA
jgi:transposase